MLGGFPSAQDENPRPIGLLLLMESSGVERHGAKIAALARFSVNEAKAVAAGEILRLKCKHERVLGIHHWPGLVGVIGDAFRFPVQSDQRRTCLLARLLSDVEIRKRSWLLSEERAASQDRQKKGRFH